MTKELSWLSGKTTQRVLTETRTFTKRGCGLQELVLNNFLSLSRQALQITILKKKRYAFFCTDGQADTT